MNERKFFTACLSLGRHVAELCLFPRYTRENVSKTVVYEGFENFERALARGKGVLFLTRILARGSCRRLRTRSTGIR